MAATQTLALAACAAPVGAMIGSFLNVVIHRLPLGQSIAVARSRCPQCERPIRAYDNVPVVSWLVLRGRCRDCGMRISVRYPLVELLAALAFPAVVLARGADSDLWIFLPLTGVLIAVAGIDLDHRIVPNKIVLPAALWALGTAVVLRPAELPELVIAGAAAFGFLLVAALARPGGMGMGDVKLAGTMGLYLGSAIAPALLVAFLTGSLVGIYVLAREGSGARKKAVPFAPFLALGGFAGIVAGPQLVDLYVTRFL